MNQIEYAFNHIHDESGLHHIESSLRAEFDILQRAHDAIHEFMYIAPLCFPNSGKHEVGWENKSAFLLYHWEVFNHAHRSSFEALCTHYNAAFILLRTTLELLLKGAFWECLSHKQFRDNASVLDSSFEGKQIKDWLQTVFEASPIIENELERVSAGIFDKLGHKIENRSFRISVKTIVQQLDQWGLFSPIVNATSIVYDGLYSGLSADIHVVPDRTDIGRRISSEKPDLFTQHILPDSLKEYATTLHAIMDVAIVIELNIFQDIIQLFKSVKLKLSKRLDVIERLGLECAPMKIREMLK